FMTGLYPHATGVPINHVSMNDDMVTFAEVLRQQGYATGYFGKWHLDGEAKPGWEPERKFGWDDNRYMYNRGHWKNFMDTPDGPKVNAPMDSSGTMPTYDLGDADEKTFPTDFLTDRTIEFIRKHRSGPFCVMLSIPDPHQPDTVRPPYDTMYSHFRFESPKTMFVKENQTPHWIVGNEGDQIPDRQLDQKNMAGYFGMVRLIDDNLAKLLTLLSEEGLEDNTVVVFTTDHGDLLGEHARHNKRLPYEGSAVSPLIVRYPGKIKAGKLIHSAMTSADFPVTMLSILQSKPLPGKVHGRDLSAQFLNDDPVVRKEDITYTRGVMSPLGPPPYWIAAISDRYKLVIGKEEKPWLIDLQKDPDELINFYSDASYRSVVSRFSKTLRGLLEKTNDPALNDPDLMQWLR
ncbi:MAG: sulfatase-like hydrolase/transferase, partial [Verrucomicrobiae bacterium]|nr:sulfatase-like hydrolase/transferase [Verrucomicrobiae bacterium]